MAKKDEIGKEENRETRSRIARDIFDHGWDQDGTKAIGLLSLIQIVSVPSVVKLVWIDRTKTGEEKMKSGKKKIGKLRSGSAKGFLTTKGAK